jgi:hypothetical protein
MATPDRPQLIRSLFDLLEQTLTRPLILAALAACPNCTLVDDTAALAYRQDLIPGILSHFEVQKTDMIKTSVTIANTVQYMKTVLQATAAQIANEARHIRNRLPLEYYTSA